MSASRSDATITKPPRAWTDAAIASRSRTSPSAPGYCRSTANASASAAPDAGPVATLTPIGSARVRTTSVVCANTSSATTMTRLGDFVTRSASAIASAAAVASSSIDALVIAMAVRSHTIVW